MSRKGGLGVGSIVLAAVTFAAGVALGGVGPRGELRVAKDEIFELKRQQMRGGHIGREIAELVRTGLDGRAARPPEPVPRRTEATPSDLTDHGAADLAADLAEAEFDKDDGPSWELEIDDELGELSEDPMEAAREALQVRATQARAALVEDIDPTPEQEAQIDAAVSQMNDRLVRLAEDVVAEVESNGEPSRRAAMGFMADALDILVSGEDGMLDAMTPEQREIVRQEATDSTAFIDPAVIDVIAEIGPMLGE